MTVLKSWRNINITVCVPEYKDRETKNIEKVAPRGIVYFKEDNMPLKYNDLEVRIISRLASYDMNSDRTLEEIVEKLYQDTVISMDLKKKWLEENGMFEFIHICQSVCTVLPIMNNDRLIRQSGAFLLPGKFIVTNRGDNLKNAIIAKAESNLRNEFEGMFFYIDDNNKEKIRTELENCNISEANLFPELEYQLKYIRKHNEQFRRAVSYFEKFEKIEKNSTYNVEIKDEYDIDKLRMVIGKYDLEDGVKREIENVFLNNQDVDWIKRDSVISRIKIQICKKLLDNGYVKADAEKLAKNIIAKVIREK